jgi:hypothetical protein
MAAETFSIAALVRRAKRVAAVAPTPAAPVRTSCSDRHVIANAKGAAARSPLFAPGSIARFAGICYDPRDSVFPRRFGEAEGEEGTR